MGKTYEALERAEKEYQEKLLVKKSDPEPLSEPAAAVDSVPDTTEQFESLKTNVLSRYSAQDPRTVAVCSTALGDGVSTTCIYYAAALARDSWRKVLLVDTNVRHPYLHEVFKVGNSQGLTDHLAGDQETGPPIVNISSGNLYLLPVGSKRNGIVSLFESKVFDIFLSNIRQSFDHVIFDCPPLSSFSETRVISAKMDGVILVINTGRTRQHVAMRAKKSLQEAGANVLGAVLNKRKYYIPDWLYYRL